MLPNTREYICNSIEDSKKLTTNKKLKHSSNFILLPIPFSNTAQFHAHGCSLPSATLPTPSTTTKQSDKDSTTESREAVSLIVNGFCKEVLQQLPMEFAVEAQKLVAISLEGSVG